MSKPKIKEKLPEKLAPVEPDTRGEMEVTEEKVGAPIKEDFVSVDELKAETFPEEDLKPRHGVSHDSCIEEWETSAKPAQPDKYPSHAGKKEEQPFLFGEADQILNALETELSQWQGAWSRLSDSKSKLQEKMNAARDRIEALSSAVDATRKHAPMKEDPAPPELPTKKNLKAKEALSVISHPTEIPEDQPEPETTTSSYEAALEDTTPSDKEDLIVKFRNPTQPLPELLFPGDILVTSWEAGPYRIEEISGPYDEVEDLQSGRQIPSPNHFSIKCSDVDAKRNKDGRLPKNYEYSYLNMVLAVDNRFLSVYADSQDEVMLTAEAVDKKDPEAKQADLPSTDPAEEDIY